MLTKLFDPKMPQLSEALGCQAAQHRISKALNQPVQVLSAQLLRHKPGRRALIAYQVVVNAEEYSILGKIRAKGLDRHSYQLQTSLWDGGFSASSLDGLSVPEPLGTVPDWKMWLQRQVPGLSLTRHLGTSTGLRTMAKVAQLSWKLHQCGIQPQKTHGIGNEIAILRDRLSHLAQACPQWANRLEDILIECDRLGQSIAALALPEATIHRDFYADQVLVDGNRLWLVDFDLCCHGHQAIDLGNFIAHIREYSLRHYGSFNQLEHWATSFLTTYLEQYQSYGTIQRELQGFQIAIEIYTYLTMVRHISISWQISERQIWTEALLDYCEGSIISLQV